MLDPVLASPALWSLSPFLCIVNVTHMRCAHTINQSINATYFSAFFWAFSALLLALFFFLLFVLLLLRGSEDCFVASGNLNALLVDFFVPSLSFFARFRRYHTVPTTAATSPTNNGVWGDVSCFFFFLEDLHQVENVRMVQKQKIFHQRHCRGHVRATQRFRHSTLYIPVE
jgi:hypothetical protein